MRQYRQVITEITKTKEINVLATLIEATFFEWARRSPEIEHALFDILEVVSDEEVGLLNKNQEKLLWEVAFADWYSSNWTKSRFAAATLNALAKIGSEETLIRMRQLVRSKVMFVGQESTLETARLCLPQIEARLSLQGDPNTLLRPSLASTTDMLLRPASGIEQVRPEEIAQLLRPTVGQEQENATYLDQPTLPSANQAALEETQQRLHLG